MSDIDQKTNRWKRRFLIGGASLAVLVVAWQVGLTVWRSHRVEAELSRIRAAGEPVTPEELARMAQVPAGEEDVTALWLKALAGFSRGAYWRTVQSLSLHHLPYLRVDARLPPPGEVWPEQDAVERLLTHYQETLRLLHEAAGAGGTACYVRDFRRGFDTVLPHVGDLRTAALVLRLEAHVRARRGDARGAAASIRAIFAAARSLSREPCTVSQLVRVVCDEAGMTEIGEVLSVVDFSDEQLAAFEADLRAVRYEEGIYRGMLAERVGGLVAFRDPTTAGATGKDGFLWQLWVHDNAADYLERMSPFVAAAKMDWVEAIKLVGLPDDKPPKWESVRSPLGHQWSRPSDAFDHLRRPFAHLAGGTALDRAADAAIGVERYRRRTGRLPERLEDLVPEFIREVPADPFRVGPLLYRQRDDGFVVYSVGVDGRDDGGVDTGGTWEQRGKPDVVFRLRLRDKSPGKPAPHGR